VNKKILFFIILAAVLVPSLYVAQANSLGSIVDQAASSLAGLTVGLSTIAFIVAGIMYLSAAGNPSRLTIAKGALIAAVIGIVIVVLATGAQDFVSTFFGIGS
jgi:sorbitol-specific phosphotransferase system component IIBC